jgi:uncharacterized membrane protein
MGGPVIYVLLSFFIMPVKYSLASHIYFVIININQEVDLEKEQKLCYRAMQTPDGSSE